MCIKCGKGKRSDEFSVIDYMAADGSIRENGIICHKCVKDHNLKCKIHDTKHVIFIDLTHVCSECVKLKALQISKDQWFINLYNKIAQLVNDRHEHDKLVRVATGDDNLTEVECLAASFETFCGRMELDYDKAKALIFDRIAQFKGLLVDAILPSLTHK